MENIEEKCLQGLKRQSKLFTKHDMQKKMYAEKSDKLLKIIKKFMKFKSTQDL